MLEHPLPEPIPADDVLQGIPLPTPPTPPLPPAPPPPAGDSEYEHARRYLASVPPCAEGERNNTLNGIAYRLLERFDLSELEHQQLCVWWALSCVPPMPENEARRTIRSAWDACHRKGEAGTKKKEPYKLQPPTSTPTPPVPLQPSPLSSEPRSLRKLITDFPDLRPPIIKGLLREGETMNVISAPKIGKSWLVIDLALAIATGRPWLGMDCVPGEVLILDNELHGETSAHRIPKVALARQIPFEDIADRIFVENLRGRLQDLFTLAPYFRSFTPGRFKVVILDAFYRFLPMRSDENDNGTMASFYNCIDSFADHLKCAFVLIHHTSKGNQSLKDITDVGAGGGAQSRATDTHVILRHHEEHGAVVLDAAVRSWPPVDSCCLRWNFPVWSPANDLDPSQLRQEGKKRTSKTATHPPETDDAPHWIAESFAEAFVTDDARLKANILLAANEQGLTDYAADKLIEKAEARGLIHRWVMDRNRIGYARVPQPLLKLVSAAEPASEPAKRELVESLLRQLPELSNREIARRCDVAHSFVNRIRKETGL